VCHACGQPAGEACIRCGAPLCAAHAYREAEGEPAFCRACADELVGVCDVCDALYARPCEECGRKVCAAHRVRVVKRWGWGGAPGQGGLTDWFPMRATYCAEHGAGREDAPRPQARKMKGYDGSSPEW
jgi:hypothetical protein